MSSLRRLLACSRSRTCDYTIGGIYMWRKWFDYRAVIVDNTLFMTGIAEGMDTPTQAFSMPVGTMNSREAINAVLAYCHHNGITPFFSAVPEEYLDVVCDVLGCDAKVDELEDWADYLYDIQDLASFHGKRYNKKRNHVNRFVADNPHWRMEMIDPGLLPEAAMFLSGHETTQNHDPLQRMADYEYAQSQDVIAHWSKYPFEGAVLRGEDGDIVALTVAEVIGDTAYVHIEKARHEVAGAGEAICHFFAQMMLNRHSGLRYMNREEDVGDESLRYAKNTYHPIAKLRKYNVYIPEKP